MVTAPEVGEGYAMEGWFYLLGSSRLGIQYSRKRYIILEDGVLSFYKTNPTSRKQSYQVPVQTLTIDSNIRVADNGRETINRSVFYVFSLYNTTNHTNEFKLGSRSSEEAARWIRSLMDEAMKEPLNKQGNVVASTKRSQSFRLSHGKSRMRSIDWTILSSAHTDVLAADVIAPSTWTIIGCNDGLRLFKEAKDGEFASKVSEEQRGVMAVAVVDATSETVFRTVMSLGPSRSEWDFCLLEGKVLEQIDGHTDIIHKKLRDDWLPWSMKRRDLLLQRYWRREDDGTYVILYHSICHKKYQPERGYIRAYLRSGGYTISPVNQGKQSLVRHMLAIDWRFWSAYFFSSSPKYVTLRMLGRIAGLREFFRAKQGNCTSVESLAVLQEDIKLELPYVVQNDKIEDPIKDLELYPSDNSEEKEAFDELSDATDEFFDVSNESEFEEKEIMLPINQNEQPQDQTNYKLTPAAAVFVKKLHDVAVMNNNDLQKNPIKDYAPCSYGATLPKDASCSSPGTWAMADPSTFLIRGGSYLQNNQKTNATSTLMQLVAADWLVSDKREDNLSSRPGGIVQKYAAQGGGEFFFVVHIQVPGTSSLSLALYYMMEAPLGTVPLLEKFVKGDDAFRNSRFKLIPYISKGSWIVKQSVGKKACMIGQALHINYFHGSNYIEIAVDVGSSAVAKSVVGLVQSYLTNLVIEMAFLIQGNTEAELPEFLIGTCKLNHIDTSKAIPLSSLNC